MTTMNVWRKLKRWAIRDAEDEEAQGSLFACSRDCAEVAAEVNGAVLVSCEGRDGVDEMTVCDGGCQDWNE